MKKFFLWAAALATAVSLVACGGGHDPIAGAATDLTVSINPDTGAKTTRALTNQQFNFTAVPAFGTTGTTTLAFTNTSTTPAFSIASGSNVATGTTTFGSCRFNVNESTFPPESPLAAGKTVVITNCQITIDSSGVPANGQAQQRSATLVLNGTTSASLTITVTVAADGSVIVNGQDLGTVPVRDITGA